MKLSFGRFRKGKKAFRNPRRKNSAKKIALAVRYQSHLVRIEKAKEGLYKAIMSALIQANSAIQIAAVRAKPIPRFVSEEEKKRLKLQKALAIMDITINLAESMGKIHNQIVVPTYPTA